MTNELHPHFVIILQRKIFKCIRKSSTPTLASILALWAFLPNTLAFLCRTLEGGNNIHTIELKINLFFSPRGDEHTHKRVELPLVIVIGLRAHLTKTTTKSINKNITLSWNDNVLSKLKESIHVLKILIVLVKYEIPKNITVSRGLPSSRLVATKWHNDIRKKEINK